LARDAGLLTFDDRGWGQQLADPNYEAHQWLQQILNLSLTIAGRDRARGREIVTPLPDPDQDDGRLISGLTLEEIARGIGDTFTPSQLPTFFVDSGVPEEFVPAAVAGDQAKWEYAFSVLERLHDGGSAARRVLREFIDAWLSDRLHESPTDRERIASLHASVRQVAGKYLDSGHLEVAIFEAFKAINIRVKEMTGIDDDGQSLMGSAMRDENPLIRFGDLTTETGRNIQAGFRFMFMGAVRGIRNPDAHEKFRPLNDEEAFEELSFASMLMRRLDDAVVAKRS
jgi:uncharacterized protein (TIGR02391 family)